MHFHLPKPVHGWRQLVGEVGIIVVGVLIALGGEQVVEALHWRHQVEGFRDVVHREIAADLGSYEYRMKQNACVKRRLDELEKWLAGWRAQEPRTLARPIGSPSSLSLDTSVWESRDANLVSHMPIAERMIIGRLYDEFANNEAHRLDERETWLQLAEYDGAPTLDNRELMRLRGLISRARFRDNRITSNATIYLRDAAKIGVQPKDDSDNRFLEPGFCASLFSRGAS